MVQGSAMVSGQLSATLLAMMLAPVSAHLLENSSVLASVHLLARVKDRQSAVASVPKLAWALG